MLLNMKRCGIDDRQSCFFTLVLAFPNAAITIVAELYDCVGNIDCSKLAFAPREEQTRRVVVAGGNSCKGLGFARLDKTTVSRKVKYCCTEAVWKRHRERDNNAGPGTQQQIRIEELAFGSRSAEPKER